MQYPNAKLLIFAKAPVPGEVKTRLIPALGETGAAALYRQLLRQTVRRFSEAAVCPIECWCAPDISNELFAGFADDYSVVLQTQRGADLGERMSHAAKQGLAQAESVVLIGADCPLLTVQYLQRALEGLVQGNSAVLGPAEDGGYVLLGLNRHSDALFEGISWGEAQVLQSTRNRLVDLGWRWKELELLWDLDRPEDYQRFCNLTGSV